MRPLSTPSSLPLRATRSKASRASSSSRRRNPTLLPNSVNNNFFTTNTTERDLAIQQGFSLTPTDPLTFIYPTEICGAVPFYRVFNPGAQANFYTTSESRRLDSLPIRGMRIWELLGIFCRSWLRSAFEFYICNLFVFGHGDLLCSRQILKSKKKKDFMNRHLGKGSHHCCRRPTQ
ncbi:hypothetical protein B0H14DRAFT_2742902 [Mycena olivaceomarginata]|nr:hypothetical protein B0H14DRAFT_2742902 [Mycena olivaceomarginata]